MQERGFSYEWARLRDDLADLEEIRVEAVGRELILRSIPRGDASRALQAVGVALGPALRIVEPDNNGTQTVGA